MRDLEMMTFIKASTMKTKKLSPTHDRLQIIIEFSFTLLLSN